MRIDNVAVPASQNYRYGWHDKGVGCANDNWQPGATERLQQGIDTSYKQYCLYHLCFIFLKGEEEGKETK